MKAMNNKSFCILLKHIYIRMFLQNTSFRYNQ